MKPDHALNTLVDQLDLVEIPHMVTGSFASTYHGISRTTLDVDVVIDPSPGNFPHFLTHLAQMGFYVSEANAKAALRARSQFNVVHIETVWKIDLIVRKNRPFSQTEFARREAANILGVDTYPMWPPRKISSWPSSNGQRTALQSGNCKISRASSKSKLVSWTAIIWRRGPNNWVSLSHCLNCPGLIEFPITMFS